jgi:hypothetical protein
MYHLGFTQVGVAVAEQKDKGAGGSDAELDEHTLGLVHHRLNVSKGERRCSGQVSGVGSAKLCLRALDRGAHAGECNTHLLEALCLKRIVQVARHQLPLQRLYLSQSLLVGTPVCLGNVLWPHVTTDE